MNVQPVSVRQHPSFRWKDSVRIKEVCISVRKGQVEETAEVRSPDIAHPIRDVHEVNVVTSIAQNVQQEDQGPRIVNVVSAGQGEVEAMAEVHIQDTVYPIRDAHKVNVVAILAQNVQQEDQDPRIANVISTATSRGSCLLEATRQGTRLLQSQRCHHQPGQVIILRRGRSADSASAACDQQPRVLVDFLTSLIRLQVPRHCRL